MSPACKYGNDAPGATFAMVAIGAAMIALSAALFVALPANWPFWPPFLLVGIGFLAFGVSILIYARVGKFRVRERMLDFVAWRGDELVLDVGTGLGFLAIGAAQRLTTGKVVGIDIWKTADLSGNSIAGAQSNAEAEGVAQRVSFVVDDAANLSFADHSFDVVLSLLCLHNLDTVESRENACREMVRVLKPGGVVVLGDYTGVSEYARDFEEAGLVVQPHILLFREAFSAVTAVIGKKPPA